jgi:hypothetical protein
MRTVILFVCKKQKKAFDAAFVRKICSAAFDRFELLPLVGASRGILITWKSCL